MRRLSETESERFSNNVQTQHLSQSNCKTRRRDKGVKISGFRVPKQVGKCGTVNS